MRVEFTYTRTADDTLEAQREIRRKSGIFRGQLWFARLFFIASLGATIYFWSISLDPIVHYFFVPGVLLAMAALIAWEPALEKLRAPVERRVLARKLRDVPEWKVLVSDDKLSIEHGKTKTEFGWAAFSKASETPNLVLLHFPNSSTYFILPKQSLGVAAAEVMRAAADSGTQ